MKKKFFLITICIFIILSSSVSSLITDNLVHYYPLNETAGTAVKDMISGASNGTNTNAQIDKDGLLDMNRSYYFDDNDDYITLAELWTNKTVDRTYWFLAKTDILTNGNHIIYDRQTNGDCQIYVNTTHLIATCKDNNNWRLISWPNPTGEALVIIELEFNAEMRIYINGSTNVDNISLGNNMAGNDGSGVTISRAGASSHKGNLSSFGFKEGLLTAKEKTDLFANYTAGCDYPFTNATCAGAPAPVPGAPTVSLINPLDNNWTNDNTPIFTYNVTDTDTALLNCTLYINGSSYNHSINVVNNTLHTVVANHSISPDDTNYLWNVNCSDGTNTTSATRHINIDTLDPEVILNTPLAGSTTGLSTITYNYTINDETSTTISCALYIDGVWNNTNTSVPADTTNTFIVNMSSGFYNWSINCTDLAGNTDENGTRNLTVDSINPVVTLNSPADNNVTNDVTPSFNFTATDFFDVLSCSLSINGSFYGTNDLVNNNTATIITSNTSLTGGLYSWTVNCTDIANNTGNGTPRNITIDTINLNLPNPPNTVTLTLLPVIFNVTANFTYADTNCSIYINNTLTQTRTDVGNGTNIFVNFTAGGLNNGNNTWFISCLDNYTTENTSLRWFNLALSDTINLSSPNPPSGSLINTRPLFFNVTGNFTVNTTNCTFYLDGNINQTRIGVSNGTNIFVSFNLTNTTEGNHTWFIGCIDSTGAENTTEAWFIYDFQPPVITTDFLNNTLVFLNNLTGQFNFTDNLLLHRLNVSIDGTRIFNVTHIHADNYTYNLSYNTSALGTGNHTLFIEIADGHTSYELIDGEAYNPSNGLFNDYIKYRFSYPYKPIEIIVKLKTSSILDDWSTERKSDRYSETLIPNKALEQQIFTLTSDEKIYLANTPGRYGGQWLIIGDHWRDFKLKNEPEATVEITLLDDYNAEITIKGIKNSPEKLEFDSIGDINIVNVTYNFYKVNMTNTFNTPVSSNVTTQYHLVVELGNLTFPTGGLTPAAIMEWNNTINTTATLTGFDNSTANFTVLFTPPIISIDTNFTLRWHFNLSNLTRGFLTTINETQLVLNYTGNSINFTIIKLPQNTLLTQTVNLTLTGTTITYNFNTSTGVLFVSRLNDDTYHVRAESNGYIDSVIFITISNQSHVNRTIYMSNSSNIKRFTVIDGALDPVSNATLSFLQNVNGTFVIIAQAVTDFSGIVQVSLDELISYNFNVTHSDFDLFTGTVTPVLDEYTIKLDEIGLVFYESIEEQVGISTEFFYTPNGTDATANYTVISLVVPNVVEWYSMNTTYNGTSLGGNATTGTISFFIPINLSIQNIINITYNIKITGHEVYTWTEFYYLPNVQGNITSLTGGLFTVTGLGIAGRVILAMFLTIIIMVAVGTATRSLTAGAIVGMFVLMGTMVGGLIPFQSFGGFNPGMAAVTTLVVLAFLIVSDQLVGRVRT